MNTSEPHIPEPKLLAQIRSRLSRASTAEQSARAKIARQLTDAGDRVYGVLPVSRFACATSHAIEIVWTAAQTAGIQAAYVDANVRQPALQPDRRANIGSRPSPFATHRLSPHVALLSPMAPSMTGSPIGALEWAVLESTRRFDLVLADLTGFEALGELDAALCLVDQLILIGHRRRTRERDLVAARRRLERPIIGVILVN